MALDWLITKHISKYTILTWVCVGLYIVVIGAIVSLRHAHFYTQVWDLGAFDQIFWNTLHGNFMGTSLENVVNHFGMHMSPWLLVLIPGYALFQSPYYLLITQTIALALGAVPLFYGARIILASQKWAFGVSVLYLLYPSLHWINLFDFHSVAFFIPLFLAGFYFSLRRQWGWALCFLLLSASTKENAILVVIMMGIYLLLTHPSGQFFLKKSFSFKRLSKQQKVGLWLLVGMIAYFIVTVTMVMPAFSGGIIRVDRYTALGDTPQQIITTLLTEPQTTARVLFHVGNLKYMLLMFFPLLFIPLIAWRQSLLFVPGLLQNVLSSSPAQISGTYHYDAILIPGIFIALVYGLSVIKKKLSRHQLASLGGVSVLFILFFLLYSPFGPVRFQKEWVSDATRRNVYSNVVSHVPEDVSVAAQRNLIPHLSEREYIYFQGNEPTKVDVLAVDRNDYWGFRSNQEWFIEYIDTYRLDPEYITEELDGGFVVIRKIDL